MNNKIQTIKKKAYGYRNVQRFINAIYFASVNLEDLYYNQIRVYGSRMGTL